MSDAELDTLLTRARDYTTHSHAHQTLKNYAADWMHFSAWCAENGRRALPASPETILCFIVALADRYANQHTGRTNRNANDYAKPNTNQHTGRHADQHTGRHRHTNPDRAASLRPEYEL